MGIVAQRAEPAAVRVQLGPGHCCLLFRARCELETVCAPGHLPLSQLFPLLCHIPTSRDQARIQTGVSLCAMAAPAEGTGLVGGGGVWRDSAGVELCSLCPPGTTMRARRLHRRANARKLHGGPQRAHRRCITRLEESGSVTDVDVQLEVQQSLPSAADQPVRAPSPDSPAMQRQLPASSSSLASSSSTSTSEAALREQFRVYGHARVPASPDSFQLAWEILQLPMRQRGEQIAGKVKQFPLQDPRLVANWTKVAQAAAAAVGVTSPEFLVDAKLLIAPPGQGLQAVHWDTARTREAHDHFACILFCSNGASSTALPTFPTNEALSFSHDREAMRQVTKLLQPTPDNYSSTPAQPGEVIVFRLSTPHYGVANGMRQGNRVVLFGLLSSSDTPGQDAQQVFAWLYTRYAFEKPKQPPRSLEFAWSLVQGAAYEPLERILLDEGKASRDEAEACLILHGLLQTYHAGRALSTRR